MKSRLWHVYGGSVALATLLYYTLAHYSYLFNAIGASSPLMIVAGVALQRPQHRIPWYLLALGQALFIAGDVVAYNYQWFFGIKLPYPSSADALYLSVYPCLALALLLMIRYRLPGRDWAGFLDALMVTVSVGTLSWVFLIEPNWRASQAEPLAKLTSVGYPIMDLLLVSVTARLAFGPGRHAPSLFLILGATSTLFVTDSLYGWSLLHEPYVPGSGYLELGWITFYAGLGMAALHPSMESLTERAIVRDDRIGWGRLALLGVIALLPTSLRLTQSVTEHEMDDVILIGSTFTLFVLVMLRMAGLIHLQEKDATRERVLREVGAALVTATTRDSIRAIAITAMQSLAGNDTIVRVYQPDPDDPSRYRIVTGSDAVTENIFSLNDLGGCKRLPQRDEPCGVLFINTPLREILQLGMHQRSVFLAALSSNEESPELMLVGTRLSAPQSLSDALVTLSSLVALAFESVQLTEKLLEQRSEARFASLVKNSSDVVAVFEADTSLRYVSPSAGKVLGYGPAELEGKRFIDLVALADQPRILSVLSPAPDFDPAEPVEFRILHRDGHECFVEALRTDLTLDPNVRGIVLNMRDVSERKTFESRLTYQAFHDSLTGLANRALFRDHVQHALDRWKRDGQPIAVFFMDIDDFKTLNDSLGHAAGDQVLREVGERVHACLRVTDIVARLGGDEFAVLIEDGNYGLQVEIVAGRLLKTLEKSFPIEGKEVLVRASIGIAILDTKDAADANITVEYLLRNADVAMYVAKDRGKGRYQIYEPAMHDILLRRLELKADLQVALDRGEFALVYQPVIDLQTGAVTGTEALLRWRHPIRGIISPAEFVPLAEETGQIIQIGQWVLQEACRYAAELRQRFARPLDVAVNLSARQLQNPALSESIRGALSDAGLDPSALVLEITETVMMQDVDAAITRLHQLKALGVHLAIDDFGTGYSSLNYIRRFPLDILKIDKSFVDGINDQAQGSALTQSLINLATILKLHSIAEGIERAEQLTRLQEMGCEFGQGYLFSKPVDPAELERLIAQGRPWLLQEP